MQHLFLKKQETEKRSFIKNLNICLKQVYYNTESLMLYILTILNKFVLVHVA